MTDSRTRVADSWVQSLVANHSYELCETRLPATKSLKSLPGRGIEGYIVETGEPISAAGAGSLSLGCRWPAEWPDATDDAAETLIAWDCQNRAGLDSTRIFDL